MRSPGVNQNEPLRKLLVALDNEHADPKSTPHNPTALCEGEATCLTHIYGHLLLEPLAEKSESHPRNCTAIPDIGSGSRCYVEHRGRQFSGIASHNGGPRMIRYAVHRISRRRWCTDNVSMTQRRYRTEKENYQTRWWEIPQRLGRPAAGLEIRDLLIPTMSLRIC
jgi:hypothetical protein